MKILLLPLCLLLLGNVALGCACTTPDVPEALKRADAVFSGQAIAMKDGRVRFKVERVWKGISTAEATLLNSGALISKDKAIRVFKRVTGCNFEFEKGEKYLVYAARNGEFFDAHVCSRTKKLTDAGSDLKELGEGKPAGRKNKERQDSKDLSRFLWLHRCLISVPLINVESARSYSPHGYL